MTVMITLRRASTRRNGSAQFSAAQGVNGLVKSSFVLLFSLIDTPLRTLETDLKTLLNVLNGKEP